MNKHNFTSIELIGSKRHFYQKMELHERKYINRKKVAVVFSGDMSEYYDVIDVLNATKKLSEYTFLLKPPPGEYFNQFLSVYSELADYISFKHFVFDEGLDRLFEEVETVVFMNTTVGIEAYIKNKICIHYSTGYKYSLDLTESIADNIYYADKTNLASVILSVSFDIDNKVINTEDYFKRWEQNNFKYLLDSIAFSEKIYYV